MFYIRSSDLIHLIPESLYPFPNFSLFQTPSPPDTFLATTFIHFVSMSLTFFPSMSHGKKSDTI